MVCYLPYLLATLVNCWLLFCWCFLLWSTVFYGLVLHLCSILWIFFFVIIWVTFWGLNFLGSLWLVFDLIDQNFKFSSLLFFKSPCIKQYLFILGYGLILIEQSLILFECFHVIFLNHCFANSISAGDGVLKLRSCFLFVSIHFNTIFIGTYLFLFLNVQFWNYCHFCKLLWLKLYAFISRTNWPSYGALILSLVMKAEDS